MNDVNVLVNNFARRWSFYHLDFVPLTISGMTVKCRAVTTRCTKHVFTILKRKSKFLWRLVAFACDPRSPKFMQSPPIESYRGWWTIPFFSCKTRRWLISYSVNVKPPDVRPGLVYQLARKYFRSRNIKCNVNLGFERLDRLR